MLKNRYQKLDNAFDADHMNFWGNLSRVNNLLVVMNISMFFLTGLVAQGYFYTFYSLICLGVVGMGSLIPTTLIRKLWYYWIFLATELTGLYFSRGQCLLLGSKWLLRNQPQKAFRPKLGVGRAYESLEILSVFTTQGIGFAGTSGLYVAAIGANPV